MGEIATVNQPTKLERFVADLLDGGRREALLGALPRHISPEKFERELSNALMQQPELMAHDPRLVFREIARIAALGLRLERDLGEAYLIEAWNGRTKRKEPQARIGYRGLIKLAKQSGTYTKVYAREVRQNDQYDVLQGTREELVHRPVLHGDPGPVIEYYAVAQLKDGTAEFERMTLEEVLAIRDRSEAWKAFEEGKIKSTPWATDESEMAKKTAIRRLCKRLDQSPELTEAIKIEDEAEFPSMRDVTPPRTALRPPPAPKPRLVAPSPKVGQRAPASRKPAPEKRTGEPYKKGGAPDRQASGEADPEQATAYDEQESKAQLLALREELDRPLRREELVEIADRWRATVQNQFLPQHQKVAEAALHMRALDVFEGDGGPSFFPEQEGEGAE